MPEDVAEASRGAEVVPESIRALEAGRCAEAEGRVLEAYMKQGYKLEANMHEAQQSWNKSVVHLGGASDQDAMNAMD